MRLERAGRAWAWVLASALARLAQGACAVGVLDWERASGQWGGLRSGLAERGVVFEGALVVDASTALRGGLEGPGSDEGALRYLVDARLLLDAEALVGWPGASFGIAWQRHDGLDGTQRVAGDFQVFSNIDAQPFSQLNEWWWEQRLLEKADGEGHWLRLRIGKLEANGEFAYVENGGGFINSSAGFSPTVLGFPSYPDPSTAVVLFLYPAGGSYLGIGVFDGATQDGCCGRTGNQGPQTALGPPGAAFLVAEVGLAWDLPGPGEGRGGVGAWRHTGQFDRFAGGVREGATGLYLVLDQQLLREHPERDGDDQGLAAFFQFGQAPGEVADVDLHLAAGLTWTGALPGREQDVVGVMPSWVRFSDEARAAGLYAGEGELTLEAYYEARLAPWLALKPDLQYIANPGGASLEDVLVGTLRLEVAF